jgi:hypothetical protein
LRFQDFFCEAEQQTKQSPHEGRALLLRCTTAAAAAAAQLPLPLHVLNIVTFTCNNAQRSKSAGSKS